MTDSQVSRPTNEVREALLDLYAQVDQAREGFGIYRDSPSMDAAMERAAAVLRPLGTPRSVDPQPSKERAAFEAHIVSKRDSAYLSRETDEYSDRFVQEAWEAWEARATRESAANSAFQDRVYGWARECFGVADTTDREMRAYRFIEEALELAQACGCTRSAALRVLEYVYGRPPGVIAQEAGGTMVTLAVLCRAFEIDMNQCGENELARVQQSLEEIRARHALKPRFGAGKTPLPPGAKAGGTVAPSGQDVSRPPRESRQDDGRPEENTAADLGQWQPQNDTCPR